ncbi:uncharacterized protein LOC121409563 [Lytechinus variegatus]|uniref:uncharacterized protein LOC121409563 n=1 Tax=Lytechinus variegatus TaxID=7654 RepID=UPI001BB1C061|nr:uncharacterized protein LOC121409563 [Lytechinus variegatus]
MATTRIMLTSLCLSVMVCVCVGQRWRGPRPSPSHRLNKTCDMYRTVQRVEKIYGCNQNLLDKVADLDEKVNIFPFRYMRRLYRWSRDGKLCYEENGRAVEVLNACEALDLTCRRNSPKTIDHCWRVIATLKPTHPQGPQGPKPKPPGRGM